MTSITADTFKDVFPQLVKDLDEASYIALDFEFTGISRFLDEKDFLKSPEDAFREKIDSANTYRPMQLGVSIFYGDDMLDNKERKHVDKTVASEMQHKRMVAEAEAFWPVYPLAKSFKSMICSIASSGTVKDDDIMKLKENRDDLVQAVKNAMSEVELTDSDAKETVMDKQLQCFNALNEANQAISLAVRWKEEIGKQTRLLFCKNYSCYLLPASSEKDDHTICLSAETLKFLRRNTMDFNEWINTGLSYVPLKEYLDAKQTAFDEIMNSDGTPILNAGVAKIRAWATGVFSFEDLIPFLSEMDAIERFLRTADVEDTMQTRLPFLAQPVFMKLCDLLQGIGLRLQRKTLYVTSIVDADKTTTDELPRYFGTRVLYALVHAIQNKNKPLIVHNGAMDLTFFLSALFGPLTTLQEFKRTVRRYFPVFYDTRTLTCAPSLQSTGHLTGPLLKTFKTVKNAEHGVRIFNDSFLQEIGISNLKEHDAASDAFMCGALFALAQSLLKKENADFRQLRCITPLHGSIFSVLYESDDCDCFVQAKNALAYHIKRPEHVHIHPETLREKLTQYIKNVCIVFAGEDVLLMIGEDVKPRIKSLIDAVVKRYVAELGISVTPLDLDARCLELNLRYISEIV